jgi:glycosyltransferase involved in cell wall biosynthesis
MPCFNAERFVEQAVRSVFTQDGSVGGSPAFEVELVVVDDGSKDRSLEVLHHLEAELQGRMRVYTQPNRGPYPARNLGLRYVRGDWVAFLDADDYWAPAFLETLLAAGDDDVDLVYCGWQNIGGGPSEEPYVPPRYEDEDTVQRFLRGCPWPIHAALTRRRVVQAIGGFSERRFSSMDYDFWLRAYAHSRRIRRVPQVLAYYRWHGQGQISSVKWKQVVDAWKVKRDFIAANSSLVAHLDAKTLRGLTDERVLQAAYQAFWGRDLVSSRQLFRRMLATRSWRLKDLKYLLPSLLPEGAYRALVRYAGRGAPSA